MISPAHLKEARYLFSDPDICFQEAFTTAKGTVSASFSQIKRIFDKAAFILHVC